MTHGVREVQLPAHKKLLASVTHSRIATNVNLNDIAHNIVSERPFRQLQYSELTRIPYRHASQHFACDTMVCSESCEGDH